MSEQSDPVEDGQECPWCYAVVPVLVGLWDPATLACDSVCPACDGAYWSAPLVIDADGLAHRAMADPAGR